jgi:hypothetical protein
MKTNAITHAERALLTVMLQGNARLGFKIGNSFTVWTKAGSRKLGTRSMNKLIDLGYIALDTGIVSTLTLTAKGTQLVNANAAT